MKKIIPFLGIICLQYSTLYSQLNDSLQNKKFNKKTLKFNLNEDGTHYFQAVFMNQTWLRYTQSNEGTTLFQKSQANIFDIGLRRTRIQLFGQITDRAFVYFQFGQNNFNTTAGYNASGNRKIAAFFHDALCEYKISKKNQLKIGGGLTVLNGLSRFSQPSVGTIMTMDVPVFLQYSVDQIDQFDRRLAIYARGQLGKLDYRLYLSNPFPINSNGSPAPALGSNANFINPAVFSQGSGPGIHNQVGGYFAYNFFENESHTTPYMSGTYLGSKKIWNIAVGAVYQKDATWNLKTNDTGFLVDTNYNHMMHLSLETFLDLPLNKEKATMLSAFAGYYNTNYGYNYLRYNGIMNPGTGSTATNLVQASAYGNSLPMFGTGQIVYAQVGYLLSKNLLGEKNGQLMPYLSAQYSDYQALQNKGAALFNVGLNWYMSGQNSKLSLDYQNRPTFYKETVSNNVIEGTRKGCVTLQYQISI
jgi:hypothetical protein